VDPWQVLRTASAHRLSCTTILALYARPACPMAVRSDTSWMPAGVELGVKSAANSLPDICIGSTDPSPLKLMPAARLYLDSVTTMAGISPLSETLGVVFAVFPLLLAV